MKNLLVAVLLAAFTLPVMAQKKEATVSEKTNVLKINTLSLLIGTGSLFYEHKLSDKLSGQMGVGFLKYGFEDTDFSGLFLTPELRFYPNGNAIDGFYMAPYLRYNNYTLKADVNKATYTNIGGGFLFGRQWVTNSGFTMDLFFGGHYGSGKIDVEDGTEDDFSTGKFDGFRIRTGFSIGFAF